MRSVKRSNQLMRVVILSSFADRDCEGGTGIPTITKKGFYYKYSSELVCQKCAIKYFSDSASVIEASCQEIPAFTFESKKRISGDKCSLRIVSRVTMAYRKHWTVDHCRLPFNLRDGPVESCVVFKHPLIA